MKTCAREVCAFLLAALLLAAIGTAQAATYNDGGTHTISGADTDVSISNGTTVNVVPGATIAGASLDPAGHSAVTVLDSASTLNVSGGTLTGGNGSHSGGNGLLGNNGQFTISGGTFGGGSSSGTSVNEPGGNGAYFLNYQSLSISNGSFSGGSGFAGENGYGLRIDGGGATAQISGGNFGGLHLAGGHVHITNGQFTAASLSEGSAVADVAGGEFSGLGLWSFHDSSVVNVSGGQFDNGASLNLADHSQANISNGELDQINLANSATANVSGGQLTGEISLYDNAVMNLSGGQLLPPIPPAFYMQGLAVLNVYGTGLSLDNVGGPNWQLHGTLADGTLVPDNIYIELHDSAVVNLYQVPEPSTIRLATLAGPALTGWISLGRWRRFRRSAPAWRER